MVKAVDEICASCGKSQPKKGSLTQWIGLTDTCRCAVFGETQAAAAQTSIEKSSNDQALNHKTAGAQNSAAAISHDSLCKECGKHLQRSTGSLTQWVFRQDMCTCQKGNSSAQSKPQTKAAGAAKIPTGEDLKLVEDSSSQQASENGGTESSASVDNGSKREDGAVAPLEAGAIEPGHVIARHYEVISCLGEGGTSIVYKAKHQYMDRVAAIKVLSPDRIPDAKTIQRFQQEARSVSRLKHPNIVDIHEFGVDENKQPFLIMDYLEGYSLFDLVEKEGPLKPSRAAALFLQMTDALQHAHDKGVIHRDLKPTNAIVTRDAAGSEQVKLVDFGIAKLSEPEDKEKALTQTGEIFGSPFYMSPEQCKGLKLDHRSDIYSFGCLMYELVIGEPAAKSGSVVETLMLHINGLELDFDNQPVVKKYAEQAKNSEAFEDAHEQKCLTKLKQIIQGCIKKEPTDRYRSMEDIKRELERLLRGNQLFGAKGNAPAWTGITPKTDVPSGSTKAAAMEMLPVIVVIGGFLLFLVAVFLKFDPFNTQAKTVVHEATATPMSKSATHVLVATLANGSSDPIEELNAQTVSKLEKDAVVTIRMRNTQVSDSDLALLAQISSLETIDLTGSSGFRQESLEALSKLANLKTLVLAGTDVSDKLSITLVAMPLERLDLSYSRFTEKGIEKLLASKSLRFLKPYKILNNEAVNDLLAKRGWKPALRDWYER